VCAQGSRILCLLLSLAHGCRCSTGYCIAGYVGVRGDGWMDAMQEREMEAWVGMSVCGGRMNK
jgi:hypothetical protein